MKNRFRLDVLENRRKKGENRWTVREIWNIAQLIKLKRTKL